MKKILHLSYSRGGGAGRVAELLFRRQNENPEYQSEFIYKIIGDLRTAPSNDIRSTVLAGIDNYIIKNKSFNPLFSLTRDKTDTGILQSAINHEGIIHLHWINGMLNVSSLSSNELLSKPIVWTMHDMVPITGGCHYSLGCNEFQKICNNCPAVKNSFRDMVSKNKKEKNLFFSKKNQLSIVVPSEWYAKKLQELDNLEFKSITVISNPIEENFFKNKDKKSLRDKLKLPLEAFIIGFVSQDIANPLKNFSLLLQMLERMDAPSNKPILVLAIGGSIKQYESKNFKVIVTGVILDVRELVEYYATVDVMISVSIAETFGMSIPEAAAQGVPSMVMKGTATEEIVIDNVSGYVFSDEKEFIIRINEIIKDSILQKKLGNEAKKLAYKRFNIENILKLYDQIYENLIHF